MPKQKVKNNMTDLDIKVSNYLDMQVGIYFSRQEYRNDVTLGEFIVSGKCIYPEFFEDWWKEPVRF